MADKKSFIVHFSTYESIKDFDDAQLGKIFRAMCEYAITGKEITLTKMLKVAFRFVKSQMDADIKKYKETCEKRSYAGRSSAQKRAESKSTNVSKCQQNEQMPTKATDIDVDIDVDVDNRESDILKNNTPTLEEIKTFCKNENLIVNPELFFNHYEANGWKYPSGNKVVAWQSELRKWDIKDRQNNRGAPKKLSSSFKGRDTEHGDTIYANLNALEV